MNEGWNGFMWNGAEWNGLAVTYTLLNAQFALCFVLTANWGPVEISAAAPEC